MILFLCYPKCTTCQKARKWLDSHQIQYEARDIKTANPSYEELQAWYAKSNLPLRKFFNTSGLIYKSLNLKEKLDQLDDDAKLKLLATDGMLVKRPLLISDNFVLAGFKEDTWQSALSDESSMNAAE